MAEQGTVLVTGASTGIGAGCAIALDAAGFQVFAGVRKPEAGTSLQEHGSARIRPIILDVTSDDDIGRAVDEVSAAVGNGGLAGLVNNAGISVAGPLEFLPIADFRKQMEVNVTGQVAVTQAFLPLLRKARGRIVNMGSTSGFFSVPMLGAYNASKHALEAISDTLRVELRPWGIHVALVQPGAIATPIWEKSGSEAETMMAAAPPAMQELYGPLISAIQGFAADSSKRAAPVSVVSDCVLHALTARRPKTRYLIGRNARPEKILSRMPDRLRDWAIAKSLKG